MNSKRRKILIVIGHLQEGGAQRVAVTLANQWSLEHEVSILTHFGGVGYPIKEDVRRTVIFNSGEIRKSLTSKIHRRIVYPFRLYKLLGRDNPDVVISFLRGMNWRIVILCWIQKIRVIATEHTVHTAELGLGSWLERRLVYKLSCGLVVLTEFDRSFYARYLPSVWKIVNPLPYAPLRSAKGRERRIIAIGSLNRWHIKGFDTLLRTCKKVLAATPEWRLVILGGGNDGREYLMSLAKELMIEEFVEFPGFVSDVKSELQLSEIFVLSSRYEGFSMALLEAMSQGCACVSFDCEAGPRELIRNGENGLLVKDQDEEAMAESLFKLIRDEEYRKQLGAKAIASSESYALERVAGLWAEALG